MSAAEVACPACRRPVPALLWNTAEDVPCPHCRKDIQIFTFPALSAPRGIVLAVATTVAGEATCFFHAENQAAAVCENCGRFICSVCRLEFGGRILCPACIGGSRSPVALPDNQRVLYDGIALALALLPMLVWPFTCLTAPATLGLVIWAWRKPASVVRRGRARLIIAGLMASLQLTVWFLVLGRILLT